MKLTQKIFLGLFLLTVLPASVFSQDSTPSSTPELRKENAQNRQEIRDQRPDAGLSVKDNLEKRKENISNRQEIRTEKREAVSQLKEKMQAAREQFKTKLEQIKDTTKKAVVERMDTRLAAINQNQTGRMLDRLNRLTNVVNRLQQEITSLKTAGKDTSNAEDLLVQAQTAIETAKAGVTAQAEKSYAITLTDETGLRGDVGTTVSQLKTDLAKTHQTVIDAKQAVIKVHSAIKVFKSVPMSTTPPETPVESAVNQISPTTSP